MTVGRAGSSVDGAGRASTWRNSTSPSRRANGSDPRVWPTAVIRSGRTKSKFGAGWTRKKSPLAHRQRAQNTGAVRSVASLGERRQLRARLVEIWDLGHDLLQQLNGLCLVLVVFCVQSATIEQHRAGIELPRLELLDLLRRQRVGILLRCGCRGPRRRLGSALLRRLGACAA